MELSCSETLKNQTDQSACQDEEELLANESCDPNQEEHESSPTQKTEETGGEGLF